MRPFTTMLATWSPDRPGDWIFHCHIAFHVVPEAARLEAPDSAMHARMSDDPRVHMAGLVLGIAVAPSAGWKAPARRHPRAMRLYIQQAAAPRGRAPRSLGYVLQSGSKPPAADSVVIPAPTLVLTRGQPTDITVINRLGETAAIHWHGVELESWSDGVAGWSGLDSMHAATAVAPGDSFVAHLTLPRAGTFLYHTHMNDLAQLTAGLYGAIVVLPPGQRFDPARDHVFITGWDGPGDTPERLLVNGDSASAPLEIRAGVHRMRFGNIGPADAWVFRVVRDTSAESWRAIAKDGADLPPALATEQPAAVTLDVGETADFAWHPAPGEYRLTVSRIGKPVRYERRIVVR
jgi:FtsP/CotA-like multicopper oxidase with cupredoxin domain